MHETVAIYTFCIFGTLLSEVIVSIQHFCSMAQPRVNLGQLSPKWAQPGPTYRPSKCNLVPFGRNFGPSSVPHGLNVWGMASRTPWPKTRVFTGIFLFKYRWSFMLAANLCSPCSFCFGINLARSCCQTDL